MRFSPNLSIRGKLVLLILASIGTALLLSFVGFAVNDYYKMRNSISNNLRAHASMLAFNSTAVLSFRDEPAAQKLLESLKSQPTIEMACLYDSEGNVLATYRSDPRSAEVPPPARIDGYEFTANHTLDLFLGVVDNKEFVGTLFLRDDVSRLQDQVFDTIKVAAGLMLFSAIVAGLLGILLQRAVSKPILDLASAAENISAAGDYSVRVETASRDEIGSLYRAFNEMLDRVQTGENQLRAAHDELEERVLERTAQLRDEIAQRERTQADLERALKAAEAAARAKSEFLANMSHEIRTPITAILGYVEILLEEHKDQLGGTELTIIERNSHHLLGIINDILDISKIEADRLSVENIPCSIVQILAEVHSLMQVRTISKGLKFHVEFVTPVPKSIRSDPTRLRQILINLTANAVKFTPKGEVNMKVSYRTGEKPILQVDIFDTGIGIGEDAIPELFRHFSQADTSTTRRFGGTGLGLCISKRLAEKLGGDVELVESRPGGGSHFRATVTAHPVEDSPLLDIKNLFAGEHEEYHPKPAVTPVPITASLCGRVLLVEDGPDNQRIIAHLLKKSGLEVEIVENGLQGVEAVWTAVRNGAPFDLVLMDMQMPVMDGYEATTTLRRDGYDGAIVALTAHAMSNDSEKCRAAGCTDYASKPIQRMVFFDLLKKYLRTKEPKESNAAT
jgi:signal transduction histidine kinase/ActR/RegA family two-component response regulator